MAKDRRYRAPHAGVDDPDPRQVVVALVFVALMLMAPVVAAEPWLRAGFDPGRTGALPFEGPETNDTAFQVRLPGVPTRDAEIIDGSAYVQTRDAASYDFDGDTSGLDQDALWRIDLSTGEVDKVMDLPGGSLDVFQPGLAVLQDGDELVALEMPSGEERWRITVRADDLEIAARDYGDGVVLEGVFYVHFVTWRGTAEPFTVADSGRPTPGMMAVDLDSGEILWETDRFQWQSQETAGNALDLESTTRYSFGAGYQVSADETRVYVYGRFVAEDTGVYEAGVGTSIEERHYEVWALDSSDGDALWTRTDSAPEGTEVGDRDVPVGEGTGSFCCGHPVVTDTAVHIRLDAFQALNKADGTTIWESPAGRTDQLGMQGSFGMGARGDMVITTSPQTVYRLDAATGDLEWMESDPEPDKAYSTKPVAIDAERVYVETVRNLCGFGAPGLEAHDLETGALVWSWHYQPRVGHSGCSVTTTNLAAFGPGVIVKGAKDGLVTVLGKTEASMGAPRLDDTLYPVPGKQVTLDLSDSAAGAFGPATRYMVDWGDGTVTAWQDEPVFTHVYDEAGEVTARAIVGNDANQTASSFVTMRVGEDPPNWLAERFEPGNQDMTFGVLGILVALTGGVIGVTQRHRRRTRLQQELETLQKGYEDTKENPGECEAFLETRKARARSLVLDGVLNEEQFGIIASRIEELGRDLRTSLLDTRFQFLPHGMVQSMRKMLSDGQITAWEREALDDLLEREDTLTEAQKAKVRYQLDRWSAADVGEDTE